MRGNRGNVYQWFLILLGLAVTAFFGVFLYRELFPEYKIYQKAYQELEGFRASYSGQPIPAFKEGVKQIVIEREDRGPPLIDRCTSCHVALQFEHFSKTKIGRDVNGNILLNPDGTPVKVPNENYVFLKLDEKIQDLKDPAKLKTLEADGKSSEISSRLKEAASLEKLKAATVSGRTYQMNKVLAMHPLMGRETRPFEYHPIEEYGCTSCHSGNGRGLTTEKAHGPVFDEQYEAAHHGYKPAFLEIDKENDPVFATIFNNKPDDSLLFMTTPLFVGGLIEAKCVQCHKTSSDSIQGALDTTNHLINQRNQHKDAVEKAYREEIQAFLTLLDLKQMILAKGYNQTLELIDKQKEDLTLSEAMQSQAAANQLFLRKLNNQENALKEINQKLKAQIQDPILLKKLTDVLAKDEAQNKEDLVQKFIQSNIGKEPKGLLFSKAEALQIEKDLLEHVLQSTSKLGTVASDQKTISGLESSVDLLTKTYTKGQTLFLSQACYACHRIAGLSRSGVGPELSYEGKKYPWFVKESIVWPQADLPTSTMPNMRMDHEELEALTTFLLAQTGKRKHESDTQYKIQIQEWEAGKKRPWELPTTPDQIENISYGMTVFATEGCAACHKLKGFQSNVGFAAEKNQNENELALQKELFVSLFPEDIKGSEIVSAIVENRDKIQTILQNDVHQNSILEAIEESHPGIIASYYSNFKFAKRAKNKFFKEKMVQAKTEKEKAYWVQEKKNWQNLIHLILMAYIEEYGLGRLVGPRPNWSGIYRSDEWLMEHFRNPSAHVARSIMPVFPFDDTKFYALTKMLDALAIKNRDAVHARWKENGFNPEEAYEIHCAQCHGPFLQGNGPVATWIYPIPKNLRNPVFLRNLTKEQAIQSIIHGVSGTPMPPWGEVAADKPNDGIPVLSQNEANQLVDWLFSSLSGGSIIRQRSDVLKWKYGPEDVLNELKKEGRPLKGKKDKLQTTKASFFFNPFAVIQTANKDLENPIFDVKPPLPGSLDEHSYFIKKEFYTTENLSQGKKVFELNCAVCHGKDADGRGARAGPMEEAKPRMLTNLNWIESRDDLRLLRSIKYGVPGTSMTPWGDQTSSLQRLQLVMYIRSLSQENTFRQNLSSIIYEAFDRPLLRINELRANEYQALLKGQEEKKNTSAMIQKILANIASQKEDKDALVKAYDRELSLTQENQKLIDQDNLLKELIALIGGDKKIALEQGIQIISLNDETLIYDFLSWLELYKGKFSFEGEMFSLNPMDAVQNKGLQTNILESLDHLIDLLDSEKKVEEGRLRSFEQEEKLHELEAKITQYKKMKNKLIAAFIKLEENNQKENELSQLILKGQVKK